MMLQFIGYFKFSSVEMYCVTHIVKHLFRDVKCSIYSNLGPSRSIWWGWSTRTSWQKGEYISKMMHEMILVLSSRDVSLFLDSQVSYRFQAVSHCRVMYIYDSIICLDFELICVCLTANGARIASNCR